MGRSTTNSHSSVRWLPAKGVRAAGLAFALLFMFAASASASFQMVGTFSEEGSSKLFTAMGMAVNIAGAGGVPVGTFYAAGRGSFSSVARYDAQGNFIGEWGENKNYAGVGVDPATGDVYVSLWGLEAGNMIKVYSPDGLKLIASFGEVGLTNGSIASSPEKIHYSDPGTSNIAVDGSGTVYVSDRAVDGQRVMVFKPQTPGDYEHYVYTGRAHDIATKGYTPDALAVDAAGNLYVNDAEEAIDEFTTGEPSTLVCHYTVPGGEAEALAVNPQNGEVYYHTPKHTNKIFKLSSCNAGGEFVQSDSFALAPNVHEEMRALVIDPALRYAPSRPRGILYGVSGTGLGYILAPAEVHAPVVESASVTSVDASSATLGGLVNPEGWPTRYRFQYISDAAYQANPPLERFAGAAEAPVGGAQAGNDLSSSTVGALLLGLAPDTEYHYRIVATSNCNPEEPTETCEGVGTEQSFRTFPGETATPPDGRAYELVSPVLKSGGEVFPIFPDMGSCSECKPGLTVGSFPVQSSPDGESVVYEGAKFSSTQGAVETNEYLSRRGGSGWQTATLSPAQSGVYVGVDASLGTAIIQSASRGVPLSGEAPEGYDNLYSQPTGAPSLFAPVLTSVPPDRPEGHLKLAFAGGSGDFSRLFFAGNDALTGETPVAPAAIDGGEHENNLYETHDGQLSLVNVLPGNAESRPGALFGAGEVEAGRDDFSHAISEDGARVFWSDGAGHVYVREDGKSTVAIPDVGRFLTAAADGSKVLLTDGHVYDLGSEETVDLTGAHGGFQGIVGQSEDLAQVYFVDTSALTEEANARGQTATAGQDNLYAWHDGSTAFVATLASSDKGGGADWTAAVQLRTAEASPDGRWVAFMSVVPLTGYDNQPEAAKVKECAVGCHEVFLYDSTTGMLACASCDPTGMRPLGSAHLPVRARASGSFAPSRYLTDQGRVFFDASDSLSSFDTNNGVEDVYEYEPGGVGGCTREQGCRALISGGRGGSDSNFLAADATGRNVFFTTRDQLVGSDHDELIDLYDAREGGGEPATEHGASECEGEACQASLGAQGDPALSSLSFEGPGDLAPLAPTRPQTRVLTRAQRLAGALALCKRKHKRARPACRRAANRKYGGKTAALSRSAHHKGGM